MPMPLPNIHGHVGVKLLVVDEVEEVSFEILIDQHWVLHLKAAYEKLQDDLVVGLGENMHLPREVLGLVLLHHLGLLGGLYGLDLVNTSIDDVVSTGTEGLVGERSRKYLEPLWKCIYYCGVTTLLCSKKLCFI